MTLKEMKMALCEIYVGFYRANSTAGKTWNEYCQYEYIQKKARDVWCRMDDRLYVVHIPRWMSHLGSFYVRKNQNGGIMIYRENKEGEKVYIKTIPSNPLL